LRIWRRVPLSFGVRAFNPASLRRNALLSEKSLTVPPRTRAETRITCSQPIVGRKTMRKLHARGLIAFASVLAMSVAVADLSMKSSQADTPAMTPEVEAELTALVNRYTSVPDFVAPGDPIDIKSILGGKLLYSIPVTSANP